MSVCCSVPHHHFSVLEVPHQVLVAADAAGTVRKFQTRVDLALHGSMVGSPFVVERGEQIGLRILRGWF